MNLVAERWSKGSPVDAAGPLVPPFLTMDCAGYAAYELPSQHREDHTMVTLL